MSTHLTSLSNTKSVGTTFKTRSLQGSGKAFLKDVQGNAHVSPKGNSNSSLIPREELLALSADFKSGAISKDEVSNRFIDSVVNNSLRKKLNEKDRKKLVEDISEFFSQDQEFQQKLAKSLSDLA